MRLKNALQGVLNEEELQSFVGSYDVVGDIVIIIIPEILQAKEKVIAEAVLASNRKIRVVAKRAGYYGGEFRTIPLVILAGEDRKETEVTEFGVRLLLNPETVYYSVRSGNERRRVAALVQEGEEVLVLFCGAAPYPLIISKFSPARRIVGVEKNPEAHRYGLLNLSRNRRQNNIDLYRGDAKDILAELAQHRFDRIVMPLPTKAIDFLPLALRVLKLHGWLHFYDLQKPEHFNTSCQQVSEVCRKNGRIVESAAIFRCGHCAPRTFRICIDAQIR